MLTFYFLVGILYVLMMGTLAYLWRSEAKGGKKKQGKYSVSIILPFRNEAHHLPTILDSVFRLDYERFELILVDDGSDDGSWEIAKNILAACVKNNFSFLLVKSEGAGKKAALNTGISQAKGEIILTTDADCRLPENWLHVMTAEFSEEGVHLVAGPVLTQNGTDFFDHFQQIEWASILLLSKVSVDLGNPLMCSGANLAFRKSAFKAVEGYQGNFEHLSGDDEFLLKKMVRKYGAKAVFYQHTPDAVVVTVPQRSLKSLFSQRIRWASKWKMHRSWVHALSALAPVLFQLIFLSAVFLVGLGYWGLALLSLLLLSKILGEWYALSTVLDFYDRRVSFWSFVKTSCIHPFFVLGVVIGVLIGKFDWKGRNSSFKP